MSSARNLIEITERIFSATLAPAEWTPTLEAMTELFGADHAVLVARENSERQTLITKSARLDEANFSRFLSHQAMRWMEPYLQKMPEGMAVTWSQLASDAEIERSPFYNEIVRPANGYHAVASRQEHPAFSAFLAICRPRQAGDFATSDAMLLQRLLPCLTTALELQCRLHIAEERCVGLLGLLDRLDTAVIVTDAAARAIFLNKDAARIMAEGDGLGSELAPLTTADSASTQRLHELVTMVALESAHEGRRMRLPRPSGRPALLLNILPISRLGAALPGLSAPRVAIFIKELDEPRAIDRDAVAESFGLTARESEVAALLAMGTDLPAIATNLGMSYNTVRTHLLRIFDKTGVHSQAALVALLWRFMERDF